MRTPIDNIWDTPTARDIARVVAGNGRCGPAVAVWVAAVWNDGRGRVYDPLARVRHYTDGARYFHGRCDGRWSLAEIVKEESRGDLRLSSTTDFSHSTIDLEEYDDPVIIRQLSPRKGLHYTALYHSTVMSAKHWYEFDKTKVRRQDNEELVEPSGGAPGLQATDYWRHPGSSFSMGAQQVVRA